MTILNHKDIYKARLLQQFKSSTNLIALIDALIEGQGELETVLDQLLTQRSVETAIGLQLDIIGEIVGQPRSILDTTGLEFFGYAGAAGDIDGYGTITDSTLGARYRGASEETGVFRELGDTEYRIFIKAKIFKNVKNVTIPDLQDAIVYMLGEGSVVSVLEEYPAKANLTIISQIPVSTAQLLVANDAIPRPAGVGWGTITFSTGDGGVFAFSGFGGLGSTFGEIEDPTVGGTFAEII
tara:strand:- start:5209 stop:5925 length:717 start_codon:yes stop_codon:yes gene_type:complete